MKKNLILMTASVILAIPGSVHVWDELAILARPEIYGEGFILEKYP